MFAFRPHGTVEPPVAAAAIWRLRAAILAATLIAAAAATPSPPKGRQQHRSRGRPWWTFRRDTRHPESEDAGPTR